ncbi:cadherin repeat domain-containing protein [Belnapia sp. T6]|uniref:Cadherin repeat domain-containing protein n=1 Tax=Belnapia mucosa TaxID=2804532 RepID=A0ABS1V7M9_9PROT|nr:cadherin repeat domain-containing protein [Belnapia mucosa]MBL6456754.1 cadherin repeat domain-containing protein [Belnapia mucosa]
MPNRAPTSISLAALPVAENQKGAVIGTLSGTDPDSGDSLTWSVLTPGYVVTGDTLSLAPDFALDFEALRGQPAKVKLVATDRAGATLTRTLSFAVTDANEAPTRITLSNAKLAENAAGAVIGTLAVSDPDAGDLHRLTVSDDRFEVVGNALKLRDGIALDYEAAKTVTVTVTATDRGGLALSQDFRIAVQDANEAPTDITLSATSIRENAAGAVLGSLRAFDPDTRDSFAWTVSDDRFEVVSGRLKLKAGIALNHEAGASLALTVTATDKGGLSVSKGFTIGVQDVNEAPSAVLLSFTQLKENQRGAVVGSLQVVDPDAGDNVRYRLSDNRFEVRDGMLKLKDSVALPASTLQLTVTAFDKGGLSKAQAFTLTVANPLDVHDDQAAIGARGIDGAHGVGYGEAGGAGTDGASVLSLATDHHWIGGQFSDSVAISRYGYGGEGGHGGSGSVGEPAGSWKIGDVWYSGDGGHGGAAGAGGDAGNGSARIEGQDFQGVEIVSLHATAAGNRGGFAGGSAPGQPAGSNQTHNGVVTAVGGVGGNGGGAAPGGDGGSAHATVADTDIVADGLVVWVAASATGGIGDSGSREYFVAGPQAGSGAVGGAATDGGAGGAGGAAVAEISDFAVTARVGMVLGLLASATGASGAAGREGGSPGFGLSGEMHANPDTNEPVILMTFTAGSPGGDGGNGGNGGDATARIAQANLAGGTGHDEVTLTLSATAGAGGQGGHGYPGSAGGTTTSGWITQTFLGWSAGSDGADGRAGHSLLELTDSRIALGAGDDTLTLKLSIGPWYAPEMLTTDSLHFTGNSFDGGAGWDYLLLGDVGAGVVVDLAAGTLSIAGSPANGLSGFESFSNTAYADRFVDGAGNQLYALSDGDHLRIGANHGQDTVGGLQDAVMELDLGPQLDSFDELLAAAEDFRFGVGVTIDTGDGGSITLAGIGKAGLTEAMFSFG